MRLLAIDPGGVSGIALRVGGHGKPTTWELNPAETVDTCLGFLKDGTKTIVACEIFIPRPGAKSWQPDALEIAGVLRHLCRWYSHDFYLQSPADAKRFATDDKLKRLDWYTPTKGGHANDALRHLLLAGVRHGGVKLSELRS